MAASAAWAFYENGCWELYGVGYCQLIEAAFKDPTCQTIDLVVNGFTYHIDMRRMEQRSPSGRTRPLSRRTSDALWAWWQNPQWQQNDDSWELYEPSAAAQLRLAQAAGRGSTTLYRLSSHGAHPYLVNWLGDSCTQTNLTMGTVRKIQWAAAVIGSVASPESCNLLKLPHDQLLALVHSLSDPLQPDLVVNVSSTTKALRALTRGQFVELKRKHLEVKTFASCVAYSLVPAPERYETPYHPNNLNAEWLRSHERLTLGTAEDDFKYPCPLTATHWQTLGSLMCHSSLPCLKCLDIEGDEYPFKEGVKLFADGLCGAIQSGRQASGLMDLRIRSANLGPEGASALATCLNETVLPLLERLDLERNPLGNQGLDGMASALRQLPALNFLNFQHTSIGDDGMQSLLADPTSDVFPSLQNLYLGHNQLTNVGLIALTSAINNGALPRLNVLEDWHTVGGVYSALGHNPASPQAQMDVRDALAVRSTPP